MVGKYVLLPPSFSLNSLSLLKLYNFFIKSQRLQNLYTLITLIMGIFRQFQVPIINITLWLKQIIVNRLKFEIKSILKH